MYFSQVSVEEAELPALLKIAEALKVIFMIMSLMTMMTMPMTMTMMMMTMMVMTMMTMAMMTMTMLIMMMIFQVKGLVESEEERQGGGSAKATPVKYCCL